MGAFRARFEVHAAGGLVSFDLTGYQPDGGPLVVAAAWLKPDEARRLATVLDGVADAAAVSDDFDAERYLVELPA